MERDLAPKIFQLFVANLATPRLGFVPLEGEYFLRNATVFP